MYKKYNHGCTEQQIIVLHALSGWQLLAEQNYLQSFPQLQSTLCVFIPPGCNAIQNAEFISYLKYCIFWTVNSTAEISHQSPK